MISAEILRIVETHVEITCIVKIHVEILCIVKIHVEILCIVKIHVEILCIVKIRVHFYLLKIHGRISAEILRISTILVKIQGNKSFTRKTNTKTKSKPV